MRTKPLSVTIRPWLKNNLGPRCLGVLTGHDSRALDAAVHLADLWLGSDLDNRKHAAVAFGLAVASMQEAAQELAFHAIAHAGDWSHRRELWQAAGLPELTARRVCRFE